MWHTSEVDGVPVVWAEGPAPLTASLLFRVGARDESLRTAGVAHLVEHLTMSTLGRVRHDHNASVDLTFTDFTVTGPDTAVVSYLSAVCAGLAALPMGRLAIEAKVLEAEAGASSHPAVTEQLNVRFGLTGLGLADVEPPALSQITESEVRDFCARFFVRDNAVLALTGPPPDELRLDLPSGARAPLPRDVPVDLPGAAWFHHAGPATSISFVVDEAGTGGREAVLTVMRVALDRAMDRLRHDRGWLYEVDFELATASDATVACWYADPPAAHADDVRRGLLDLLRDLRDVGPTVEELAEDLAAMHAHFDDPRSVEGEVGSAARGLLLGQEVLTAEERLLRRQALTAADCRRALRLLDDTLVVGLPPEVDLSDTSLVTGRPEFSSSVVTGQEFKRHPLRGLVNGVPRGARLVVGEEGISLRLGDGDATVRWSELVGASRSPEGEVLTLIGTDGITVPVSAAWFRNGDELVRLVLDRVPPEIVFVEQERTDEPR